MLVSLETCPVMRGVVRRLVERRSPQLFVTASAGDQEMTHTPALCGCFLCWRADAGLPSTVCGLPGAREWPKGHCSGLCLNKEADTRSSCPALRPSVPGRVSIAELATSDLEPLPVVGVKRRRSSQREDAVHLSRSDPTTAPHQPEVVASTPARRVMFPAERQPAPRVSRPAAGKRSLSPAQRSR